MKDLLKSFNKIFPENCLSQLIKGLIESNSEQLSLLEVIVDKKLLRNSRNYHLCENLKTHTITIKCIEELDKTLTILNKYKETERL